MFDPPASFRITRSLLVWSVFVVIFPTAYSRAEAPEYRIDYVHSRIEFLCSHLGFTQSRGEFHNWKGKLQFSNKDWALSEVQISIDVASLDLNNEAWNRAMLGRRYFNADQFPKAQFRSTAVHQINETSGSIQGMLTLMGVTQPLKIDFVVNKIGLNPLTLRPTVGFSGKGRLSRSAFGMRADQRMVGDTVELHFEIEASRVPIRASSGKR